MVQLLDPLPTSRTARRKIDKYIVTFLTPYLIFGGFWVYRQITELRIKVAEAVTAFETKEQLKTLHEIKLLLEKETKNETHP